MLDLPTTSDEKTPLLHATVSINTIRALCTDPSLLRELREMAALALPVVRYPPSSHHYIPCQTLLAYTATFFFEYAPGIVTLVLAGHAGNSEDAVQSTLYLDAAAIAIMYMNVTGCLLVCVPIGLVNAWATAILVMLGQSHDIAVLAGDLIRIMVPSLPFLFGYELLKKPMLTCAVIGNCVNAALGYFLTFHTTWGVHGVAVARSVANACLLWSLLVYLKRLGAGLIRNARRTVQSAVVLGVSIGLAFAALLVGTRHALPLFFTQDADVIRLTAFVTVAMYQVADALNTTLQGVLRGLGLQHMDLSS
ncbi:hypothetical protein DYB37_013056 [Aphanomyces astaci]|uniref:Uncharacterized protein n=1 Tax=Aphanomyces astaci TaxID=112090 RepID=A0A3R6Y571_APHAT|nr:hypothetical protein DYB35_012460 [Aphanomyces astaci]RHZ33382.1 hypothetical protein DYB37_013056 [Aphanomyces astaci]